jgi:putative ATP-dependent endonuclease of the OLD family
MKLQRLVLRNFRSCRSVDLDLGSIHAFVGANSAGKSTILRAVEILLSPSVKLFSDESFWNKDLTQEIRIEGVFAELTPWEIGQLKPYLRSDGSFQFARLIQWSTKSEDAEDEEQKEGAQMATEYCRRVPAYEWLIPDAVNSKSIAAWWKDKDKLTTTQGESFATFMAHDGAKPPTKEAWLQKAADFASNKLAAGDFSDQWGPNPKGADNVFKGALPFFVFVPAVRDVTDESTGTKSSPFGKLLQAILDKIPSDKRSPIETKLKEVAAALNRSEGAASTERLDAVAKEESRLNTFLQSLFKACDLEIEFQTPDFETLFGTPKLYVNDGFRGSIENKGHGIQRATIFAILQAYAEGAVTADAAKKKTLFLAVEEPELYMHPQAQRTIRSVFRTIAKTDQVFFSTHSSFMVDVTYFDEIIRMETLPVEIPAKEGGIGAEAKSRRSVESKAWQVSMSKVIRDIEIRQPDLAGKVTELTVRERFSNAYNPTRNEGFFANRVILTEGATEEYALPIYAEGIRWSMDQDACSVISCGGKHGIERLFVIFNELGIPTYIVFDYDKGSKPKDIEDTKVVFARLGVTFPSPFEKDLIGDRLTCLFHTWETTWRVDVSDHVDRHSKALEALGFEAGKASKPLVARFLARQLTQETPPIIPPTVSDILTKARAVKHAGTCLLSADQTAN